MHGIASRCGFGIALPGPRAQGLSPDARSGLACSVREPVVCSRKDRSYLCGSHLPFPCAILARTGLMRRCADQLGFRFDSIPPLKLGNEIVSSSRIRASIQNGGFAEANRCLGRPFSVVAKVIEGSGRGRAIGTPTANLDISDCLMPPEGVYPVNVRLMDFTQKKASQGDGFDFHGKPSPDWLSGILNFGRRPTFGEWHLGLFWQSVFGCALCL